MKNENCCLQTMNCWIDVLVRTGTIERIEKTGMIGKRRKTTEGAVLR